MKLKQKALNAKIQSIYTESCPNVQIDILDVSKVFEAGHKAHAEGRDIKLAIVETVARIRKN